MWGQAALSSSHKGHLFHSGAAANWGSLLPKSLPSPHTNGSAWSFLPVWHLFATPLQALEAWHCFGTAPAEQSNMILLCSKLESTQQTSVPSFSPPASIMVRG